MNLPSVMRSRSLGAVVLATTAVVLCLWIEFTHRANGDTAWFLYLSRQALRGLRPYGDYVEINPPLIVWVGLPSAWLAEWTGLPITRLYAVSVAGLILGSVIWWHRLYRRLFDERASTLTPLSIAAIFLYSIHNFTQRELLIVLGLWPLVLTVALRASQRPVHRADLLGAGSAAAVAIALKPYYLAVPLALAFLPGQPRPWRDLVWYALTTAGAVYLVAILFLEPGYLNILRHFAIDYHGYRMLGSQSVLAGDARAAATPLALAFLLPAIRLAKDSRVTVLWMATLAFVAIVLVQSKGFTSHYVPGFIAAAITTVATLLVHTPRVGRISAALAAGVLLVARGGPLGLRALATVTPSQARGAALDAAIAPGQRRVVLIVSPILFDIWPLMLRPDLEWPLPVPCEWMQPSDRSWPWFAQQVRRAVEARPDIILIRRSTPDPIYPNSRIDQLRWMHADQAIHRVLREYEELPDVTTYAMFYRREATRPVP